MKLNTVFFRIQKLLAVTSSLKLLFIYLRYGVIAGVEHRPILDNRLNTIVDIGANRGQFALACWKWAPNAKVISFEPLNTPATVYEKIFKNNLNFKLFRGAIGPNIEKKLINVSNKDDSSSLLPIGINQIKNFPGTQKSHMEEVSISPLGAALDSKMIGAPALLKLDVQGYEFEALEGCEQLLDSFEFIYCECSFIELYQGQKFASDIVNWLKARKFNIIGVYNVSYDGLGKAIQADLLFYNFLD